MSSLENQENVDAVAGRVVRNIRPRLRKALPTDRASISKQLDVLRAAAVASGADRKAVSNEEVAKIVPIHHGTVSNCNPFFLECGLLSRHKMQNIPCDEVFAYADRYKWEPDKAAHKLAPVLRRAWFCTAILPKLAFRPLTVDEVVSFLAEEAGATPEYKDQLIMLVDYLKITGIVSVDGNTVTAIDAETDLHKSPPPGAGANPAPTPAPAPPPPNDNRLSNVHPSVLGLLDELPASGQSWTHEEMQGFMLAFEATLKFIYKVKVPQKKSNGTNDDPA